MTDEEMLGICNEIIAGAPLVMHDTAGLNYQVVLKNGNLWFEYFEETGYLQIEFIYVYEENGSYGWQIDIPLADPKLFDKARAFIKEFIR